MTLLMILIVIYLCLVVLAAILKFLFRSAARLALIFVPIYFIYHLLKDDLNNE